MSSSTPRTVVPWGIPVTTRRLTIYVRRDDSPARWHVVRADAVAHGGTPAERRSVGDGTAMWISQDKHSPYATYEACVGDSWFIEACAQNGPTPQVTLLNVGEPTARLSNDVGDVAVRAGADPAAAHALAPWWTSPTEASGTRLLELLHGPHLDARTQTNLTYLLFHGQTIRDHRQFLGAGDITAQLFHGPLTLALPAAQPWDAETPPDRTGRTP